jgi:hypothetical protein
VYTFSATDDQAPRSRLRYRCSFDTARLHACSARYSQRLAVGNHKLRVRALDDAGTEPDDVDHRRRVGASHFAGNSGLMCGLLRARQPMGAIKRRPRNPPKARVQLADEVRVRSADSGSHAPSRALRPAQPLPKRRRA